MQISEELDKILSFAREEAMRTGCRSISPDHLFLGILRHSENLACDILKDLDADLAKLKAAVEDSIATDSIISFGQESEILLSRESRNALNLSIYEAMALNSDSTAALHLLIALTKCGKCRCSELLRSIEIDSGTISAYLRDHAGTETKKEEEPRNLKKPVKILGAICVKPSEIYS